MSGDAIHTNGEVTENTKHSIVPEEGSFTAFKKLASGVIATLLIPAEAKRSSVPGRRKCRASSAFVVSLSNGKDKGVSIHDRTFVYKVGETVSVDNFKENYQIECAPGIHFFITRSEAEEY